MHTGIDAPGTPLVEIMVTEELDAGSEPRVRALLEDALTLHPEQLIIDLAGCPFIDATAIGLGAPFATISSTLRKFSTLLLRRGAGGNSSCRTMASMLGSCCNTSMQRK